MAKTSFWLCWHVAPAPLHFCRGDAAESLHAVNLVGEVFVAVVLEVSLEPHALALHHDAPVRVDALESPTPAAKKAQLPIGVELAVALPTSQGAGHTSQFCGCATS